MKFISGFTKVAAARAASFWNNATKLDKAGLGLLTVAPAYHLHKAVKEKDTGSAVAGATEIGGLGLLYRAVNKGH